MAIEIDGKWALGCKSTLMELRLPGDGRVLAFVPEPFGDEDWSGLEEIVADHVPGLGWVPRIERAAKSLVSAAYGLLRESGAIQYRDLRSALDRPVWEPL